MQDADPESGHKMKRETTLIYLLSVICVIYVAVVIAIYAWTFRSDPLSHNPSDWGVFGDFFGGVLNPSLSGVTLFFLARTYLLQREEIRNGEQNSQDQRYLAYATTRMQYLNIKISTSHEVMESIRNEMSLVYESIKPFSKGSTYNFWTIDGNELKYHQDKVDYRSNLSIKLKEELAKINILEEEMDELISKVPSL